MQWIQDNWELLALILVNGLGFAALLAKLTPTTTDDEWIEKVKNVVESVVAKKP